MRLSPALIPLFLITLSSVPQISPSTTARIEGSVLRADSGQPLPGARITLQRLADRLPARLALTDSAGRFTIENIPPGPYRVFVERQGFVRQSYGQRGASPAGATLQLAPGQSLRDLLFRLLPNAVISGRATDENSEPLEGVRIEAFRRTCARGQPSWQRVRSTTTNDLGEYRLSGLSPGSYFVSAVSNMRPFPIDAGNPPDPTEINRRVAETIQAQVDRAVQSTQEPNQPDEGPRYGYAPVYHPDTRDPSRAIPLAAEAGQELRGIDFSLTPLPVFSVRGQLSIPGITAYRGSSIMLMPTAAMQRGLFLSSSGSVREETGEFEIRGVVPGAYTLIANYANRNVRFISQIPLNVGSASVSGLHITLLPGASLSGRIRIEGMTPPSAAPPRQLNVQFESTDSLSRNNAGAVISPTGEFRVRSIVPGTYTLRINNLPDSLYLRAAELGSENVLDSGLRIGPGAALPNLELVLSAEGGAIEGLVLTPENLPAQGATVLAVPDTARPSGHLTKTTITDANGRFVLPALAPGSYKLFAWIDLDPELCLDDSLLAPLKDRAPSVTVSPRQTTRTELRSQP